MQLFRTRMTFRRTVQQALKKMEAGITFEMLQVLRCLWEEQGISQQVLAERIAKGKAALSNLIMNLEKKNYVCRDDIYASAGMALGVEKTRGIVSDLKLTCDVLEGI